MENDTDSRKKSAAAVFGSIVGGLVLMGASGVGGYILCGLMMKAKMAGGPPPMPTPIATVAVTNVEMRVYNLPERFVAHAEPMQEVDLLPQVDGYIKAMHFKEGDIVKEGQVLYTLDDERYQAIVNQRKADLEVAEAEARRTQRYWERMQKADSRGITQLERDNAEAEAEKSKASVLQAKANLVVAEYDLKKTQVAAPISGQIGKSAAYRGDYVAPSKGALARIVQIDPIRVSFPLTDRAYVAWREAQIKGKAQKYRMNLILPDGSAYSSQGKWDFDDNQMSKDTATIMMRLSFPNPDRLLIPNSYVTLLTDFETPPSYPSIPQQCVFDLPGGNQGVWVLRPDMTVEQRPVKLREAFEGWVPVIEGVTNGEHVVIAGVNRLGTGMKVQIVQPTPNDDIVPGYKGAIKE